MRLGEWSCRAELLDEWSAAEVAGNKDRWVAYLDAAALGTGLRLRARRPGDRFRPQGLGGHAPRLTDWMINAKIPRRYRDRLPLLVTAEGEILWVCGWRVAESGLVGAATKRVARFEFRQR